MAPPKLKKILACYTIAGLLTATFSLPGCSQQNDTGDKPEDQKTSQQQPGTEEDDAEKSKKPDGTEIQIRGKSG